MCSQPELKATATVERSGRKAPLFVLYHSVSQGSARHLVSGKLKDGKNESGFHHFLAV